MNQRIASATVRLLLASIPVILLLLAGRTAGPAVAGTADPCDILTPAEVAVILEGPAEPMPGGVDTLGLNTCGWLANANEMHLALFSGPEDEADFIYDNTYVGHQEQDLAGLGDRAKFVEHIGHVDGPLWDELRVRIDQYYVALGIQKREGGLKVNTNDLLLATMTLIIDRLLPRAPVEFTQAIQELQGYYELSSHLEIHGSPPVPIIAGKPAVARVYYHPVDEASIRTVQLSGVGSHEVTAPVIPGCTVEKQRRQEDGCDFADLYFTPPEGEWTATITIRDENGGQIDEMEFTITSVDMPELRISNLLICVKLSTGAQPACPSGYVNGPAAGLTRKLFPVAPDEFSYTQLPTPPWVLDAPASTNTLESQLLADLRLWYDFITLGASQPGFDQLAAWLPPGGSFNLGRSDPVWIGSTGRVSFQTDTSAENPLDADFTLAHEVGHNLGLRHTNLADGCGAEDSATDWPYNDSTIQEVGFDVDAKEARVDSVDPASPLKLSVMSYCSPPGSNIWISPHTYRKLAEGGFSPQAHVQGTTGSSQVLLVKGVVQADGSAATIDSAYVIESATPAPPSNPLGNHCIHLTGGANIEHCFTLRFQDHRSQEPTDAEAFMLRVPFPSGTNQIGLMRGNAMLTTLEQSPSAPSINITQPQPGAEWSGQQTIAWTASDADGGTPNVALLYSPDGTNWLPLDVDNTDGEFTFDTGDLEGDTISLRLIASDGLNTAEATVDGITLDQSAGLTWGDNNCSGGVDPVDALITLRHDAGLSANTDACPEIGDPIAAVGNTAWGDIDCSGAVDPIDALKLVRFDAGLNVAKPENCPALASPI